MRHMNRRSAPKVVGGKVQRKNRSTTTPNYYDTPQTSPVIDRRRPGLGYRHILMKRDVERFINILPDWNELSKGLNAVVQAPGNGYCDGWHKPGVVAVCAWERDVWVEVGPWYFDDHKSIFNQLGVPCESLDTGDHLCKFTEGTAKAYQLLHILLHELGHHHDRMTTKSKRESARGERYAERYAIKYARWIWNRYFDEFGLP